MNQSIKMKELLHGVKPIQTLETEKIESVADMPVNSMKEEKNVVVPSDVKLSIDYVDVDAIDLPEINDTFGRLSDIIEAIEGVTGFSVIPLDMANIAPEVVSLQRHDIFIFGGKRYAMSHKLRENVIAAYKEKIMQNLGTGLAFTEDLVVPIKYDGHTYKTLALSKNEWSYLLSIFRHYKQSITVHNDSELLLSVFAERV